MVRAYGLKDVYAGSFYTLSQGAFSHETPISETKLVLSAPSGQSTPLPDVFNTTASGMIHAIIEPPTRGRLTQSETGWLYTPPAEFKGPVELRFTRSTSRLSEAGTLRLEITDESE